MAGAKVPLTFRIFKGDQLLREERLSLSVIKLGKVPSAHLKLDDETVSRMHAIIEVNGPGDRLQDNQTRWLTYCVAQEIPVCVCKVEWQAAQ